MNKYHKIQTIFKRDPDTKFRTLLVNDYALPEFDYLKDAQWDFTEKVDGTNIRVIITKDSVTFKGKTDKANLSEQLISSLNNRFDLAKDGLMASVGDEPLTLYGEGYGVKIQSGGKYRPDQSFVMFDALCGGFWLQPEALKELAGNHGLEIVPSMGSGTLLDMVEMVKAGITSTWGDFMAEGLVARPQTQLFNRQGHRIITKLKHKDFI